MPLPEPVTQLVEPHIALAYAAYHEAGHCVLLSYSKSYSVAKVFVHHSADSYVTPQAIGDSDSWIAHVEGAMIALAGEIAGDYYLRREGVYVAPSYKVEINKRLEPDRERLFKHLKAIEAEKYEDDLRNAVAAFCEKSEIWAQIKDLAEFLSYRQGSIVSGLMVELALLDLPFHSGLPIPLMAPPHSQSLLQILYERSGTFLGRILRKLGLRSSLYK